MDSSAKPAMFLVSGRALGFAASFFIPVVLVRIFDQSEFGTYKQLFLISSTVYAIAQLGMAESLFYFLPGAPQAAGRYIFNSLLALAAAGVVCAVLLAATGADIAQWLSNGELSRYTWLLSLYLLLMLMSALVEIVMIARKRYGYASVSYAVSEILRAVLFVLPVILFRRLEWLLFGALAFASLRLWAAIVYLRREFGPELKPDVMLLKRQLAYALPFEVAVIVEVLQANFHQYAVSYHFDAATFAIYSVGCLQIPLVDFTATSVANVMMVRMSEELREGRREAVLALWHKTIRQLSLVFFPLVALLLLNGREIIVVLFTAQYLPSVPVFLIWSCAILLSAIPIDGLLRVYAETRFLLGLNVIRLLLVVSLMNWFVSAFQLVGAVLVTVVAMSVGKGLAVIRMKSRMGIGLGPILPWRSLTASLAVSTAAALPALIVKSQLQVPALPLMLAISLVYAGLYVTLAFRLGLLTEDERAIVTRWLPRRRACPAGALRPEPRISD